MGNYYTADSVSAVGTRSFLYCILCLCGVYRVIIVLHTVLLRYEQVHCFTAVSVSAVYTGILLYSSLCQRFMYKD
jgi:hypothetical protein